MLLWGTVANPKERLPPGARNGPGFSLHPSSVPWQLTRCVCAVSSQAIEARQAQLAVLAQDCDQPDYSKLIQALCTEANVNLITVPASKTLGEWVGLCKLDAEGLARKVVGCSCVVIKDYGEETAELGVLQEYVKNLGK